MRFWGKTIPEGEMESERTWLLQDIYAGHGEPVFHPQSACERYR
jgi:DNA polymerase-3 subunit epsilon